MTGLEKMKSQILEEAQSSAKEILDNARSEAEKIKAEARERAEAQCGRISEKSQAEVKTLEERSVSSCGLQRRKALLEAKQEVISAVLDKAYEKLTGADDETYFDIIRKMLRKFVPAQKGIAKEKGGELNLSKESREVEGGFVLIYGGIEENCTFKAMFSSRRDELADKVHALLFS